jgi:hypothetical protein
VRSSRLSHHVTVVFTVDHVWLPHREMIDGKLYTVVCQNCRQRAIMPSNNTWPRRPHMGKLKPDGVGDCIMEVARYVMES